MESIFVQNDFGNSNMMLSEYLFVHDNAFKQVKHTIAGNDTFKTLPSIFFSIPYTVQGNVFNHIISFFLGLSFRKDNNT